MLRVGLTGGIASGKSTVAAMFSELGAAVVDADLLARQVLEPGSEALSEVEAALGPGLLGPDGDLDRAALRRLIFRDPQARSRLNAIMHPRVGALIRERLAELEAQDPRGTALVDLPLLFEAGRPDSFAATVLVYLEPRTQIQRLMERDGLSRQQAHQALASQMSLEQKRALANFVVDNGGSLEETRMQVAEVWAQLKAQAASRHAGKSPIPGTRPTK